MPRPDHSPARKATVDSLATPACAKKISITLDETLLAEVRDLIRASGLSLSAHISQTLARDLRLRRQGEIVATFEKIHGVITDDELSEIRRRWEA